MIYFDRKTLSILSKIKRSGDKGITWEKLQKKFGKKIATSDLLIELSKEFYTVTQNANSEWLEPNHTFESSFDFRSFITPKGNELLEKRRFDFWKFIIPTIISVIALSVSVVSLLLSVYGDQVVKVLMP